jgi:hypothetical protein
MRRVLLRNRKIYRFSRAPCFQVRKFSHHCALAFAQVTTLLPESLHELEE